MKRKLAVVIGASMAGCMAARVLADRFERVLVIERDQLPAGPELRKGAPQGAHTHALLLRGLQTLERLFPGLTAGLVEAGAITADPTADFAWYQHGVFKGRWQSGRPPMISMTRPLLEWQVRKHLSALPNVSILAQTRVLSLLATADRSRVTGVRIEPVDESAPAAELAADLVVDASGRGTRAPQWLEELGYGSVPITEMKTDVRYASRIFRAGPGPEPSFKVGLFQDHFPSTHLCGLFKIEGDRWIVTLQTMLGEEAPADDAAFLAYARSMPMPELARFLETAEPLTPIAFYRIPGNLRRHYDKLSRFPDGLCILGDASTSFNPRYGQGMSTAAIGAEVLEQALAADAAAPGFSLRFQQALGKAIDLPWQMSTGEDRAFLAVSGGKLPLAERVVNWYMRRLIRLTAVDKLALAAFTNVVHIIGPMGELFQPRLAWRVLTGADSQ